MYIFRLENSCHLGEENCKENQQNDFAKFGRRALAVLFFFISGGRWFFWRFYLFLYWVGVFFYWRFYFLFFFLRHFFFLFFFRHFFTFFCAAFSASLGKKYPGCNFFHLHYFITGSN